MKTGLSKGEQEKAKKLGFKPVEYLLACLNAEINVLTTKEGRTDEQIDYFVEQAKGLMARIQLERFYEK